MTCAASFRDWMPRYHRLRFPVPLAPAPDEAPDVDLAVFPRDEDEDDPLLRFAAAGEPLPPPLLLLLPGRVDGD